LKFHTQKKTLLVMIILCEKQDIKEVWNFAK
jgi:hypothetical protein